MSVFDVLYRLLLVVCFMYCIVVVCCVWSLCVVHCRVCVMCCDMRFVVV